MQFNKLLCLLINGKYIKRPHIILGILMLIGLLLRLPSLKWGLWRDEGSTYFDAMPIDLHEVINTVIYSELNPPGFYIIMHQWMQWFGSDEVILKIPALIVSVLLIPATYKLGSLISSPLVGIVTAAITTVAPEAIYYSQEARPYALAALLSCLVIFLYCKVIDSKKQIWYLLGFVICADLLLYVQYTGLILLTSLAIITLYLQWRSMANIRLMHFFVAYLIIFLLFTPWLQVFFTHLHTGLPWVTKESWLMRPKLLYENFLYTLPVTGGKKVLVALSVLALIFQLSPVFSYSQKFIHQWKLKLKTSTFILSFSVLLSAIMLAALSHQGRYMFPFTPLAWVVYSNFVINLFKRIDNYWSREFNRFIKQIIVVLVIFSIVLPNAKYAISLGNTDKSGIRSLAADVQKKHQEKTIYLISPDLLGPTFGYYFAQNPVKFYGVGRWNRPEIFSPQGYAEVWESSTLISDIKQGIQGEIDNGYRQLVLIQDMGVTSDAGKMKYSRVNEALAMLKQKYSLLEKTDYPGTHESITVYKFTLIKN
ncbi:glycosyltransferase family 39 protein [Tolypothrix sp. FACHB-123]|uniref:glycosyltransferase family 39 protein n=1 Tax=Tolypothrix sp. FACHB-123 TaxID=2692868 RepID=UPI001686282B|nr:glycosyltransferase family 39 protein [Tolypothrix sp. FACHB-123]MBD2357778.1 glycosyltransferase family 39 protein [Tolypothrix sp. FACHB-123]